VGPVWRGGQAGEPELLAACYGNSLACASSLGLESVAFPAISCGVYGYPPERAVGVALRAVREHLAEGSTLSRVVFCCFGDDMAALYRAALAGADG